MIIGREAFKNTQKAQTITILTNAMKLQFKNYFTATAAKPTINIAEMQTTDQKEIFAAHTADKRMHSEF